MKNIKKKYQTEVQWAWAEWRMEGKEWKRKLFLCKETNNCSYIRDENLRGLGCFGLLNFLLFSLSLSLSFLSLQKKFLYMKHRTEYHWRTISRCLCKVECLTIYVLWANLLKLEIIFVLRELWIVDR